MTSIVLQQNSIADAIVGFNFRLNCGNVQKASWFVGFDGWRSWQVIFETHQIGDSIANESVSLFLSVVERFAGVTQRKGRVSTTPNVTLD